MSKSVLCAVDVSDPGVDENVLQQAARLADLEDAQLDVITVVPDFGMSVVSTFFEKSHHDRAVQETSDRLHAMVADVLGKDRAKVVRAIVSTGKAYEEILKTAKVAGSDLIVIGAHTPDLADYLLGPNAARVVRHSKCSVHVVR
ncbi:MAG: universal stress protein [Pseudomonadota bacterium]